MTKASTTDLSQAGTTAPHNGFSLISNEKLLALYTTMLKCRMLAARMNAHAGSEAPIAGLCADLLPGDTLAPGYLGFGASFIKGLPLNTILSSRLPAGSRSRFRYATLNLIPPSLRLDAQLERALAAAKANKASRNKKIVVAFCGESTAASGVLHEVMREAGKRKLAMLLAVNSEPDNDAIGDQAREYGFPSMTVDGADAVAVYRVATEAVTHARRGSGPTLVDLRPWVYPGQTAAARRKAVDSIFRMEEYLTRKGLFDKKFKLKVTASFRREIEAAVLAASQRSS
jgi:pyruvate dehydrogenase E1 component alpha subunit